VRSTARSEVARGRERGRENRERTKSGVGDLRATGGETARLVVDYVKQETLDPIKGLGRYILFGVAGSVAVAIGLVILAVALLRLLQGETNGTFDGSWSWAPYLICTVVILGVAAAAVAAVVRGGGRASRGTGRTR
jgi:Putative Actinobacterial Holin-X, holin superfamily III